MEEKQEGMHALAQEASLFTLRWLLQLEQLQLR
jgi:hypothetical protein